MTGALLLSVLAFGCGIKRYLPGKAVLDADQALAWRAAPTAAVPYRGPPRVGMPVLPLQVFGLYYDLDLVLVSDHPSWDMHEYARVDLPDGPLWLAKDARPTGVQGIVADVPDIERWAPEAAVPRQRGEVAVVDESEGDRVDVTLRYQNLDGELVAVQVQGRVKARPPGKRNGSTMGHSRQSAAVVLDLERFGSAGRVRMSIGGQRVRIKHLLGLYPMKFLLRQAQAGVMVTSLRQEDSGEGFRVHRPGPDPVDPATGLPGWPTQATEDWKVTEGTDEDGSACTIAERQDPLVTLRYVFVEGGLRRAEAWQAGRALPVTVMRFDPALPDLRRPFDGPVQSRFELEVNGLFGHGSGFVEVAWQDADTVALRLRPEAPWWLADRPMDGTIHYDAQGGAVVRTWRVAPPR